MDAPRDLGLRRKGDLHRKENEKNYTLHKIRIRRAPQIRIKGGRGVPCRVCVLVSTIWSYCSALLLPFFAAHGSACCTSRHAAAVSLLYLIIGVRYQFCIFSSPALTALLIPGYRIPSMGRQEREYHVHLSSCAKPCTTYSRKQSPLVRAAGGGSLCISCD